MSSLHSQRLIKNGLAAMITALLAGFMLIFSMIKGISLSPSPIFFELAIPGTPAGWRTVHLGMMLNGLMALLLGVSMRQLYLTNRDAARVSWGSVIAIWGNFCFYLFGMFAPNHGLTMGANSMGPANLAGAVAFLPALLGAITLLYALVIMVRARFVSDGIRAR